MSQRKELLAVETLSVAKEFLAVYQDRIDADSASIMSRNKPTAQEIKAVKDINEKFNTITNTEMKNSAQLVEFIKFLGQTARELQESDVTHSWRVTSPYASLLFALHGLLLHDLENNLSYADRLKQYLSKNVPEGKNDPIQTIIDEEEAKRVRGGTAASDTLKSMLLTAADMGSITHISRAIELGAFKEGKWSTTWARPTDKEIAAWPEKKETLSKHLPWQYQGLAYCRKVFTDFIKGDAISKGAVPEDKMKAESTYEDFVANAISGARTVARRRLAAAKQKEAVNPAEHKEGEQSRPSSSYSLSSLWSGVQAAGSKLKMKNPCQRAETTFIHIDEDDSSLGDGHKSTP